MLGLLTCIATPGFSSFFLYPEIELRTQGLTHAQQTFYHLCSLNSLNFSFRQNLLLESKILYRLISLTIGAAKPRQVVFLPILWKDSFPGFVKTLYYPPDERAV